MSTGQKNFHSPGPVVIRGSVETPELTKTHLKCRDPKKDTYSSMPSLRDRSTHLMIRLAYHGCANRPFFHVVVQPNRKPRNGKFLEQIGTYDPLPNINNEKLVAINFERLKYWCTIRGAHMSKPILQLLGLCGFLPIHYTTRLESFRARKRKEALAAKEQEAEQEKSKVAEET